MRRGRRRNQRAHSVYLTLFYILGNTFLKMVMIALDYTNKRFSFHEEMPKERNRL